MRPDPGAQLAATAARRHELTRSRAIQALGELDGDGQPVTFASVTAATDLTVMAIHPARHRRPDPQAAEQGT